MGGHAFTVVYIGLLVVLMSCCFFFKQKTAYEMRISDWSSDVCSSDLARHRPTKEESKNVADAWLTDSWLSQTRLTKNQGARACSARVCRAPQNQIGRASCRERVCQYV